MSDTYDRLIDANAACEILSCKRTTLWRLTQTGELPKPLKIGRLARWKESEVRAVIERASAIRAA